MTGVPEPGPSAGWSDVDAHEDTGHHVTYLDAVARLLADLRYRSYEAMMLPPGATVADVGCGTGIALVELAGLVGSSGRVVGIDPSGAMLAEARARVAGAAVTVDLVPASATATGQPDDTFDAVRTERVLMHVADPLAAMRELARITKPGGRVVVLEPDHRRLAVDADDPGFVHEVSGLFGRTLANGSAGLRARSDAVRAGLTDVTVQIIPHRFESMADFREVFSVDVARQFLIATGLVDAERFEEMVAELMTRDAEGRFLAIAMMYLVTGTKPERTA